MHAWKEIRSTKAWGLRGGDAVDETVANASEINNGLVHVCVCVCVDGFYMIMLDPGGRSFRLLCLALSSWVKGVGRTKQKKQPVTQQRSPSRRDGLHWHLHVRLELDGLV